MGKSQFASVAGQYLLEETVDVNVERSLRFRIR